MDVGFWHWAILLSFALIVIVLDLFVTARKPREVSMKEALLWVLFYFGISIGFSIFLLLTENKDIALLYLTGYLIEQSLSIDNMFVFAMIFAYFGVLPKYRMRALIIGIAGALCLRFIFILAGAALLDAFHVTIYFFGVILLYAAYKMFKEKIEDMNPEDSLAIKLAAKTGRLDKKWAGDRLVVEKEGKKYFTKMAIVLLALITTDIVFAVDSIPAIFAITDIPYLVMAANIFSLLGLRYLYFVIESAMQRFDTLQTGLSLVLAFVAIKLLISDWYHISPIVSLGVVLSILAISVSLSFRPKRGQKMQKQLPDKKIQK